MRPLHNLDRSSLSALKPALDGYQRYEQSIPEASEYFKIIIDKLIGPLETIDIWAIRRQIHNEDERRANVATVKIEDSDKWTGFDKLTDREQVVLKLMSQGETPQTMAELMGGITTTSIFRHKANIAQKLGLPTTRDLTKFVLANEHLFKPDHGSTTDPKETKAGAKGHR